MFLSIIIPAYNVQKYLEKCVQSCLNQDVELSSYEILIINDGSTDNTQPIAEKLAKKYNNVQVINQDNKGLSSARNIGLSHAQGKYIWFIDSDDYISTNILRKIQLILDQTSVDILWLQWQRVNEQGGILASEKNKIQREQTDIKTGKAFLCSILGMCFYAWSFIFRKEFLVQNNLRFKEKIYYEDLEAIPFFIEKANKVKYEPILAYSYLQRKGSILHSTNPKILDSLLYIIAKYENAINEYPQICDRLREIQLSTIRLFLNTISHSNYKRIRSQNLKKINHKKYPQISPYTSFIGRLMNFLWKIDEHLIIVIYKLLYFKQKCF